jgi:hypothetical protein
MSRDRYLIAFPIPLSLSSHSRTEKSSLSKSHFIMTDEKEIVVHLEEDACVVLKAEDPYGG